jgi:hypothetical protein
MLRGGLTVLLAVLCGAAAVAPVTGDDKEDETRKMMAKYQPVIDKGLQYLAKAQFRDGHWEAINGHYPIPMTALAGMALMAEGSNTHQGKYHTQIDRAVDYLVSRYNKKTGQIGRPDDQREQARYMYGHGFATMFLALAYGEENEATRRKELERVLTGAVDFIGKAQTSMGGWGYVSAAENDNFDEGSVTITQLQALRAAKDAGIPVAKEIIDKAKKYLEKSTFPQPTDNKDRKAEAGVIYSLRYGSGNVRAPLTAAAIACSFAANEYDSVQAVQWLNYCQRHIPIDRSGRDSFGHWEYTHFYYAQVIFVLGEDRHAKMRPDLVNEKGGKGLLTWSKYRSTCFEYIASRQAENGSWNHGTYGPVYTTALHLLILQLDKGHLPVFQR